ncbi:FAD-dependent oxidoreductase [Williamsia sp. 1135]|uniref:NAD(P)/FAD-dependent oxidoreductase n=1 Tax=Williamsia sp. 1135 TaxID=1889262 RepID=UPI000A0F69E9|nr:FAD-dependent oxidoreductase [Williamsia sp. 1135]ORM31877.1 amine oxidase [Williamsia sp. 1135]
MQSASSRHTTTVAVVGSGVAGLSAAYLLRSGHDVTLYEGDGRLGGHAHTHSVATDAGPIGVDSGFIVHNDRTYPLLRRLFAELDVPVRPTEMSMSIYDQATGVQYAGGRGLRGIFAQPRRVVDREFVSMLLEVKRFHRAAAEVLAGQDDADLSTYGHFLADRGFSDYFIRMFALPLVSCVWSTGSKKSLDYPARYLFAFLDNHGMLSVKGSPQWYTVQGGSRTYVDRVAAALNDVRTDSRVTNIVRERNGVTITADGHPDRRFDKVVIATHAKDALTLLADPSEPEKELLGAFDYAVNRTILHTDSSLMPTAVRAGASWNYLTPDPTEDDSPPVVTYWMNRLQGLTGTRQYYVTLNAPDRIDPSEVIASMDYEHPVFTPKAVAAQRGLKGLNTATTAFAGAYHGWGFHEDGCRSGVAAAAHFGAPW